MATKNKAKGAASKAKKAAPKKAVTAKSVKKKVVTKAAPVSKKKAVSKKAPATTGKNKLTGKKAVPSASKNKATVKKAAPIVSQKQTVTKKSGPLVKAKKTATDLANKAVKAISKVLSKKGGKQMAKEYKPKTPVISHGEDMHLIPVHGEIHPARRDEAPLLEKQFRHNQQIAWQREQQLMRQVQSQNAARKVFKTPRHS